MSAATIPSHDDVLGAVAYDEARTTDEVARVACGGDGRVAWANRTNVRNRLYELEAVGAVICDDGRPMRWLRPDPSLR